MPTLQVRDLPDEIHAQLTWLAEKDHRSLAQETIVLLKEAIESRVGNQDKRRKALLKLSSLKLSPHGHPDPVAMIREDRER